MINRRTLLKLGAVTGAGLLLPPCYRQGRALAASKSGLLFGYQPFTQPLFIPEVLTPLTNQGGIFTKAQYMDGSVFVGITPDLHIGASFQVTEQWRASGAQPRNTRVHVATNLFF